ncbi:beta-lactamase family protein [Streptomyces sp. NBC_00009]
MVVLLADAGKLDLDAPVTDVLPDFAVADADATTTITPRHLLNTPAASRATTSTTPVAGTTAWPGTSRAWAASV